METLYAAMEDNERVIPKLVRKELRNSSSADCSVAALRNSSARGAVSGGS